MNPMKPVPNHPESIIKPLLKALSLLKLRIDRDADWIVKLASESFLHPVSLKTTLQIWISSLTEEAFRSLIHSAIRDSRRLNVTTLAPGNIPIIAPECLINGLLAGVRHTIGLSTRATSLILALRDALRTVFEETDEWVDLLVWRHASNHRRKSLLAGSDKVVVYGTDSTIQWISSLLPAGVDLVTHGPSLAVGYLEPAILNDVEVMAALDGLALDLARFDQRGCRSPHILFIVGSHDEVRDILDRLARQHLPSVQTLLPRGPLYDEEISSMYLDRLTSRTLGERVESDGWSLTIQRNPCLARPSPGGRTLRLIGVDRNEQIPHLIQTLPDPVRLIGIAKRDTRLPFVLPELPEVALFGHLQVPDYDRLHDGRHRLDEYRP